MTYQVNGKLIDFSSPKVMGILNVTKDSFFDGGRYIDAKSIRDRVETIVSEGAYIIDIGAVSSKPGSALISHIEEWNVLEQTITAVRQIAPEILISIDTYNSSTAKRALDQGVEIINDISFGDIDAEMIDVVSQYSCIYIGMHMQCRPATMQHNPSYQNVAMDVLKYFRKKLDLCSKHKVQLVIDPGFGFGKTLDHNYNLLNKLEVFSIFDIPILAGLSRKSMIYKLIGETPDKALPGSLGLAMIALQKGAQILRVHDVQETVQLVKVFNKVNENNKIQ